MWNTQQVASNDLDKICHTGHAPENTNWCMLTAQFCTPWLPPTIMARTLLSASSIGAPACPVLAPHVLATRLLLVSPLSMVRVQVSVHRVPLGLSAG
jgi:hypothetical protein